jgi:hypothetical protein
LSSSTGADQLVLGQLLDLRQGGDQVVLRPRPAPARQVDEVRAELLARPHRGGGRLRRRVQLVHAADVGRPRPQQVAVVVGDAEHLGDDGHRQRLGEHADQVERPALPRLVDQRVGHRLDGRAHPLDRARRERPADQPPQPGVLRRLHVEHPVADDVPEGRLLRRLLRAAHLGVRRDVQVAAPEPPVAQQRVDVGVAGDEPPVRRLVVLHPRALAQHGVRGVRVGHEGRVRGGEDGHVRTLEEEPAAAAPCP